MKDLKKYFIAFGGIILAVLLIVYGIVLYHHQKTLRQLTQADVECTATDVEQTETDAEQTEKKVP